MNMNKSGLIAELRAETAEKDIELSEEAAKAVVDLFFDSMSEAMIAKDRIEIRGLWSLFTKQYSSYQGRNPKTGEEISVTPKLLPFFKCGKELKERVDRLKT